MNGASALAAGSGNAVLSGINQGFLCTLRVGTVETRSGDCGPALRSALVLINVDPSDCGRELSGMPYPCLVGGVNYGAFSDGGGSPFDSPSANPAIRSLGLGAALTPEQESLVGCGPFLQTDCDIDGMDILNAEASAIIQSWPGFDGTTGSVDDYDLRDSSRPGPGTVGFDGGPIATRWENGRLVQLPGSRGPGDPDYDPLQDGCTGTGPVGCNRGDVVPVDANRDGVVDFTYDRQLDATVLTQPFNGQRFANELAALSFNMMQLLASGGPNPYSDPNRPNLSEFDVFDPYGFGLVNNPASPYFGQPRPGVDASRIDGVTAVACGVYKPQLCENIRGFLSAAGARRNAVRAGSNGRYGRRDFAWQSGGELVLDYDKRNVFGFAFDFDEELTKSNWGVEATWISGQTFVDNDEFDGLSNADTINLTVSVDRPTFINFLNPGRTFFINSQWFFQYITNYGKNYYANGPLNVLATLSVFTGYHQDRLMLFATAVYDFNSASGALLPSVTYRFTESFSASIGVNVFWGHEQLRQSAINELRPGLNRTGHDAYMDAVSNGLTALRQRDEMNLTIRYTF